MTIHSNIVNLSQKSLHFIELNDDRDIDDKIMQKIKTIKMQKNENFNDQNESNSDVNSKSLSNASDGSINANDIDNVNEEIEIGKIFTWLFPTIENPISPDDDNVLKLDTLAVPKHISFKPHLEKSDDKDNSPVLSVLKNLTKETKISYDDTEMITDETQKILQLKNGLDFTGLEDLTSVIFNPEGDK